MACNDTLLTLCASSVGTGPATLQLAGGAAVDLRNLFDVGERVDARQGCVQTGRAELWLTHASVWRPAAPRRLLPAARIDAHLRNAGLRLAQRRRTHSSVIDREGAPVVAALGEACRALDRQQAARQRDRLIGWGEGLTPAGDDFLVGLIAGLDALVDGDERRDRFRDAFAAALGSAYESHDADRGALPAPRRGRPPHRADRWSARRVARRRPQRRRRRGPAARARHRRHIGRGHGEWAAGGARRLVAGCLDIGGCVIIMATTRFKVFPNLYKDSVTLMQLGAKLRAREGIAEASCIMATPANLEQLRDADLAIDAGVPVGSAGRRARRPGGVRRSHRGGRDDAASGGATGNGDAAAASALPLTSIALGLERAPDADLALISVPGDYAAAEAMKALAQGLNVMLFSDNVSIADERAIKTFARARNLLVMGPDCGTAIVNGIPLGFANVVRRGDIGLVAASGTGLQEVTCRIHNLGGGVSQALGTGGRDLKEEIGGITMLQGLAALAADPPRA